MTVSFMTLCIGFDVYLNLTYDSYAKAGFQSEPTHLAMLQPDIDVGEV
jgi:hypothetical protein